MMANQQQQQQEQYVVEDVIEYTFFKEDLWRVTWTGYPLSEATWEPLENVQHLDVWAAFMKKKEKRDRKAAKKRKKKQKQKKEDAVAIDSASDAEMGNDSDFNPSAHKHLTADQVPLPKRRHHNHHNNRSQQKKVKKQPQTDTSTAPTANAVSTKPLKPSPACASQAKPAVKKIMLKLKRRLSPKKLCSKSDKFEMSDEDSSDDKPILPLKRPTPTLRASAQIENDLDALSLTRIPKMTVLQRMKADAVSKTKIRGVNTSAKTIILPQKRLFVHVSSGNNDIDMRQPAKKRKLNQKQQLAGAAAAPMNTTTTTTATTTNKDKPGPPRRLPPPPPPQSQPPTHISQLPRAHTHAQPCTPETPPSEGEDEVDEPQQSEIIAEIAGNGRTQPETPSSADDDDKADDIATHGNDAHDAYYTPHKASTHTSDSTQRASAMHPDRHRMLHGKELRCFSCNEIGHFACDCPNNAVRSQSNNSSGPTTRHSNNRCYLCHVVGHIGAQCPNPKAANTVSLMTLPPDMELCDVVRGLEEASPVNIAECARLQPDESNPPFNICAKVVLKTAAQANFLITMAKIGECRIQGRYISVQRCTTSGSDLEMLRATDILSSKPKPAFAPALPAAAAATAVSKARSADARDEVVVIVSDTDPDTPACDVSSDYESTTSHTRNSRHSRRKRDKHKPHHRKHGSKSTASSKSDKNAKSVLRTPDKSVKSRRSSTSSLKPSPYCPPPLAPPPPKPFHYAKKPETLPPLPSYLLHVATDIVTPTPLVMTSRSAFKVFGVRGYSGVVMCADELLRPQSTESEHDELLLEDHSPKHSPRHKSSATPIVVPENASLSSASASIAAGATTATNTEKDGLWRFALCVEEIKDTANAKAGDIIPMINVSVESSSMDAHFYVKQMIWYLRVAQAMSDCRDYLASCNIDELACAYQEKIKMRYVSPNSDRDSRQLQAFKEQLEENGAVFIGDRIFGGDFIVAIKLNANCVQYDMTTTSMIFKGDLIRIRRPFSVHNPPTNQVCPDIVPDIVMQ